MKSLLARTLAVTALIAVCSAHIGSPDAWYEGAAGPYRVLVQVVVPPVVPGVAKVYARVFDEGVTRVRIQTNRYDAVAAAPPPEDAERVADDRGLYRGPLWVMAGGSNGITVYVEGPKGSGKAVIPVVVVPTRRMEFDKKIGVPLFAMLVFLVIGGISIIGASVREGVLSPGEHPDPRQKKKARVAMAITAAVFALVLLGGLRWWGREDARFARSIYKPFKASSRIIEDGAGKTLDVAISDSIWRKRNDTTWLRMHGASRFTPLILDHGKLMHLFLVKSDDLSSFAHLHPATIDSVDFTSSLPPLPAGKYRVYGDIVHESGFTQTLPSMIEIPAGTSAARVTDADDSWYTGPPASNGKALLSDGSVMTLERGSAPLVAGKDAGLRFVVRDAEGRPAPLEPYVGMPGHAVVARDDGSVFVHLHPAGTISMASQMTFLMRKPGDSVAGTLSKRMGAGAMQGTQRAGSPDGTVSFPYAFPREGRFHMWVQVKRNGKPLTGAFVMEVAPAK